MTMPEGIATVVLTGRYVTPDGTPLTGTVRFAVPSLITLSGADTFADGSVTATLDADGTFTVVLIATDNSSMQPTGWAYNVTETLSAGARTYAIMLPQSSPTVDLADIAPADPDSGDYILLPGPAGTNGKTILSGTSAPTSGVGTDGDFYINTATWTIYGPKASGAWPSGVALGGGGSGTVTSVNGISPVGGNVTLTASSVGADVTGAAASAQTAAQSYTDGAIAAEVTRADGAYLRKEGNLSELTDASAARTALGLTASATKDVGTTAGTLAAGDDSRITGALQRRELRRRDLPDPVVQDTLYSGSVTYTLAQTTTPTSGYIKWSPDPVALSGTDVRGPFVFAGAAGFQIGATSPDTNYVLPTSRYPNTYASGQSAWSVEFGTDAQIFQVRFKYIGTSSAFRLTVDGRKVADTATLISSLSGVGSAGSGHMLTVDLGSAAARRVRFDFYTVPFGGVYLPPTAVMWGPILKGQRFLYFGDSIGDGSAQSVGGGIGTWVDRYSRVMGYTDVWRQGRGGTGYITAGSYATLPSRVAADVVPYAPDELVIAAGYNDSSGSQTDIATAVDTTLNALKTGLPNTRIIVVGCWSPLGTPATSTANTDATIKARAAAAGLPFISTQSGSVYGADGSLVAAQGKWISGTGHVGATTGDGNADTYVGTDAVHLTDAGATYYARRLYAARLALLSQ